MFNNRVWKSHLYTDRKQPQAVFCKKSCFYKFRKIYRKTPVPESQPATLLKRKLWHRCFCVNFAKLLRACNFVKKGPWHRCFPMNFAKFLRTPFLQNTSGQLHLYEVHISNRLLCCKHNGTFKNH